LFDKAISMTKPRSTSWSYRITLKPHDQIRVRHFIEQERAYFNAVVTGLAGPLRTMPGTLQAMNGRLEDLFGLAAAHAVNPTQVRPEKRHKAFATFRELIASADLRTSLLFDIAASPATLSHAVRKNLAIEALRYAKDQSVAISDAAMIDGTYRFAIQSLQPMDATQKRHVQMPRSTVTVTETDTEITLKLPYTVDPITVAKPPVNWNLAILRDDGQGNFTLELCQESAGYDLRRSDASGFKKRRPAR
jgi:hypothetical protein